MSEVTRRELFPGVWLRTVHTRKFKSAFLSLTLMVPLDRERAAENALVPYVLRRGTREHPDLESLSAALDQLYGGAIEPVVRKKGETQCVGFVASFLDDAYTLNGETILEGAAGLLGELLLRPYTQEGCFSSDYTAGERGNLIDRIRGLVNDKRHYAQALRVCDEGLNRYAAYKRIGELKNIRARILQPALNIYTAEGYPSDSVSMRVNYRNLSGFTLNVYATDYEPESDSPDDFCAFAQGCTLLLLDAQYTRSEYERNRGFGHSTIPRSAAIARRCGAEQTLLIHHDPTRTDRQLLELEAAVHAQYPNVRFGRGGEEVLL